MQTHGITRLLSSPLATAVVLMAATAGGAAGASNPANDEEIRSDVADTFLHMRILAAVLETEAAEAHPFPGPTEGLVPAASLRTHIGPRHQSHLGSALDAWGNPLLYWSDGRHYLLLSLGSDGEPQFDYSGAIPFAEVPRASTGTDPTNDLLVVNGFAWRGPASQTDLLVRVLGDLRSLGTSAEEHAIDYNFYPGPVAPIAPVERIETDLSPLYIRAMPKIDPWGNPYLYWSDTTSYALVSLGADGSPDHDYETWGKEQFQAFHPGVTAEPGRDIVFVDGDFVQFPFVPGVP